MSNFLFLFQKIDLSSPNNSNKQKNSNKSYFTENLKSQKFYNKYLSNLLNQQNFYLFDCNFLTSKKKSLEVGNKNGNLATGIM
ncbi:hypothetical protein HMPREF9108_01549 [Leptotrichia sp. oral taxon 225 str. F0581]|nr:hypothetical protein HMPREF9108_01549 [Leptotrichia sp. oral taxon 225 str. F0581]